MKNQTCSKSFGPQLASLIAFLTLICATTASAFYDPSTQRWINRDPIQEKGGLNAFTFAANSPIEMVDTYGRSIWHWPPWKKPTPPKPPPPPPSSPWLAFPGCTDWVADVTLDNCLACCLAQYTHRITSGINSCYDATRIFDQCGKTCLRSEGRRGPTK